MEKTESDWRRLRFYDYSEYYEVCMSMTMRMFLSF